MQWAWFGIHFSRVRQSSECLNIMPVVCGLCPCVARLSSLHAEKGRQQRWRIPKWRRLHLRSCAFSLQAKMGSNGVQWDPNVVRIAKNWALFSEPEFLHMSHVLVNNLSTLCFIAWEKCSVIFSDYGLKLHRSFGRSLAIFLGFQSG